MSVKEISDRDVLICKMNNESMFLGIPDRWWETWTCGCDNGHVSNRCLKSSEKGSLCLACYKPVWLIDPAKYKCDNDLKEELGLSKE